jgi:hypothetical protein
MKTLNSLEAIEWSKAHKIGLNEKGRPVIAENAMQWRRFEIPKYASKQVWFCRFIESSLRPWSCCLLWITAWGIWESSENWHLYYRLRQSYGDYRLIEEAPAHLFLDYEIHDLISFLQIGLSAGWDFCLLTHDDCGRILVSHDEWIELVTRDATELERISAELTKAGIKSLSGVEKPRAS